MSTTVQGPDSELAGIARMSIALIGPNDSSRTIMAKALTASQSRIVREFADYPAKLSDVSRMMARNEALTTIMAKALPASQSRIVREFADYPAKLSDVSRMMAQNFDVVMIDLDSDESYALLIRSEERRVG